MDTTDAAYALYLNTNECVDNYANPYNAVMSLLDIANEDDGVGQQYTVRDEQGHIHAVVSQLDRYSDTSSIWRVLWVATGHTEEYRCDYYDDNGSTKCNVVML